MIASSASPTSVVEHLRRQPRRLDGDVLHQQVRDPVRLERKLTRDQLVDHDADGVDVGAVVDGLALGLLGRRVRRRAHERPLERRGRQRDVGAQRLDQAEVEQLHDVAPALPCDQVDVLGLEVAVHEAGRVDGGDAVAHLRQDRKEALRREPALGGDHVGQQLAFQELHHQRERGMLLRRLDDLGDRDDVRMIDEVHGLRLGEQALADSGQRVVRVRDLHRRAPPDGDVLDLEHAAGRPLAQLPDEAIRPDCPSWCQLHRLMKLSPRWAVRGCLTRRP